MNNDSLTRDKYNNNTYKKSNKRTTLKPSFITLGQLYH